MQSSQYRSLAFAEHGKECNRCGSTDALEVHHKDRDRTNNSTENLEVLCHECHVDEHHDERVQRKTKGGSTVEESVLDLLREGRVTAPYVAEQADYSLQYVREELTDLVNHDHVRKIHDGLYELTDDPRETAEQNPVRNPGEILETGRDLADALEAYVESTSLSSEEYETLHEAWEVLDERAETAPSRKEVSTAEDTENHEKTYTNTEDN